MRIYEYKLDGSKHQYAALDEAIRITQFIRNKCLRRKGISMYPGAQGNIRFAGKRFWTDCLYSSLPTEDEQVGWMKEEPPSIYGGECQNHFINSIL